MLFRSKIEIEIEDLKGVEEAVKAGADIIMLDNMDVETIKKAIKIINKKAIIECSGNVDITNINRRQRSLRRLFDTYAKQGYSQSYRKERSHTGRCSQTRASV